jgi:light-regulated signal transduction histidine kinase (bacteriophytochrome)
VSLTISPIKNALGEIIGASKILRDITLQKKTDLQLIKYAQELEASNKELEQFTDIASHDLQEPLRMVGSYMQLIEKRYKGKLDKDADEFIHFAMEGAARMKQLINDLLKYSRLDREKSTAVLNLNDVLNDVKLNLSVSIKEADAIINHGELPFIEGDRTQMIQLFQNLIGNAIRFRREGVAPVIDIKAKKQSDEWLFSIQDNGIGIETVCRKYIRYF